MGIIKPDYHLRSKHDLPSFRDRMEGPVGGRKLSADLNLTSLIDVFSVIILFLVSTFSATGEILLVNKDIKLPSAAFGFTLKRSPIVTVTKDLIILEGATVGDNTNISEKIEDTDWALPNLRAQLKTYKQFFEAANSGLPFPGEVIIQADKEIEFLYVKRAMFTLLKEGYNNIDLVVSGEASFAVPDPEAGAR